MGCCSREEGCAPGRGGGCYSAGAGELGWGDGGREIRVGSRAPRPHRLHLGTIRPRIVWIWSRSTGDQKLYVIFSYTRDPPLQSRWFQSPEEKSRSAGMHEKPELGKSGKNCLYSPLAFKQTQALFPFCWLWAQEPYETQTTLKDVTLGIAASSRTKALGLQGSVLKS